jgi:hypothetical protein
VAGQGDEELRVECGVDETQQIRLAGLHGKRRRACPVPQRSVSFPIDHRWALEQRMGVAS